LPDRASRPAVVRPGSAGEAVRDLQRRLAALGFAVPNEESGRFGPATDRQVRAFQEKRALRVDGVCGKETWTALVESGFRLGDRMLYQRRPMLTGDDVIELQRRLNMLGFDAGKEDGIFGPDTARALTEFQRNVGLGADGIFGPDTAHALARIGSRRAGTLAEGSVASVREREALRRGPHRIEGRRVFLASAPGLDVLGDAVRRGLREAGAIVVFDTSGDDDSALASAANRSGADLFFGIRQAREPGCRCSYYESGRFRSEAGYRVATAVCLELTSILRDAPVVCGRTHAALRETSMAAVLCEPVAHDDVAATRHLVKAGSEVAGAIVRGIRRGVEDPGDPDE
jgi:N-acetylmuramoyl-L-alanine amidase